MSPLAWNRALAASTCWNAALYRYQLRLRLARAPDLPGEYVRGPGACCTSVRPESPEQAVIPANAGIPLSSNLLQGLDDQLRC